MLQKCDYSWLFVEKTQIPVECPNKKKHKLQRRSGADPDGVSGYDVGDQ